MKLRERYYNYKIHIERNSNYVYQYLSHALNKVKHKNIKVKNAQCI